MHTLVSVVTELIKGLRSGEIRLDIPTSGPVRSISEHPGWRSPIKEPIANLKTLRSKPEAKEHPGS
jgi:hypothetical protein